MFVHIGSANRAASTISAAVENLVNSVEGGVVLSNLGEKIAVLDMGYPVWQSHERYASTINDRRCERVMDDISRVALSH